MSPARAARDVIRIALRRRLLRHATLRGTARLAAQLVVHGRRDLYVAIEAHAVNRPTDPAITDASGTWTYETLARTVDRAAGALHRAGVRSGDRVAILLTNRREHLAMMAAARKVRAIPMPLSPALAEVQVVERLREARAALAVVEPHHARAAIDGIGRTRHRVVVVDGPVPGRAVSWAGFLARAPRRPPRMWIRAGAGPDLVLHTSGTTGRSKSTSIRMGNAGIDTALRYVDEFDLDPHAVFFTPCPLYHAAPMLFTGLVLTLGGHVVLRPRWEDHTPADLARCGATHAFLVPTLLDRLSRADERDQQRLRRGPLRALISGGAALRPALKTELLDRFGPVLYDFYGATEMGVVSIAGPGLLAIDPHTVGRLLPGVEARLVADDGHDAAPGEPGELYVRSDAASPDPDDPHGGWVSAGDVARLDGDLLYIVDRKRDVVISGGVNIFPVDVEVALERHPSVREAAAFGVPDDAWGEALHAFVVLEPGHRLDPDALRAHCRSQLARYAVPKGFHAIDALPRSPTGKVLRRVLRDRVVLA